MITATSAGLQGLLDEYYAALAAGDPGRLPLAADATFTENGQRIAIGTGLWATASGAADSRVVTVSEEAYGPGGTAGQVAGWGMITEGCAAGTEAAGGGDVLLGVRLKTTGRVISEIETLAVRRKPFGRDTFPRSLYEPSAAMAEVLGPADRGTREDLVKAADGYLDGVSRDDADLIPAADDCLRVENGLQTVLNPDGAGFPEAFASSGGLALGVRAQIRTLAFRYIQDIRDRRFVAADTARGLVLVCCFFDHPGQLREAGFDSPIKTPNSMLIWEMFKVAGGLIRRIEAIGAAFPYGMRAGW